MQIIGHRHDESVEKRRVTGGTLLLPPPPSPLRRTARSSGDSPSVRIILTTAPNGSIAAEKGAQSRAETQLRPPPQPPPASPPPASSSSSVHALHERPAPHDGFTPPLIVPASSSPAIAAAPPPTTERDTALMEMAKSFAAGSISASFSSVLLQPLDLVKTRLQLRSAADEQQGGSTTKGALARKRGLLRYMTHIARTESVRGLWRGTTATIARSVPGVGLYFATLHSLKVASGIESPTGTEALVLGFVARCLAGAALLPATVIKTRVESGLYSYRSMTHAVQSIYAVEGVRGLYSGLLPTLARDAPYSGLYLLFYTQLKDVSHEHFVSSTDKLSDVANFVCGVIAGLAASVVTQPADVLKTRIQSDPVRFPTVTSAVIVIARSEGVQGFFSGLTPRLLRRTLMSALAWTFYERLSKRLLHPRNRAENAQPLPDSSAPIRG